MDQPNLKDVVREKYGQAALNAASGSDGCCGSSLEASCDPITSNLYDAIQEGEVPDAAKKASLGCGNPTALIELTPGQTVLDLGSGGGIDVLLSARRVGPTGKAYGLDMTDEMVVVAREHQQKAGVTNAEFLKGSIEAIPLPDQSVDVVMSNCVINLASDKDAVVKEAFRVLKPGGRFAVADVVVRGEVPDEVRRSMELWVGCIAGALDVDEYEAKLRRAGFVDVGTAIWRTYDVNDAREFLAESGLDADRIARELDGIVASAFVRAQKPRACCDSVCCA